MAAKKVGFGGVTYSFKGRQETMEQVFGKVALSPPEMMKKLWAFVKAGALRVG